MQSVGPDVNKHTRILKKKKEKKKKIKFIK